MTEDMKDIRDWMFRGLSFESEADKYRAAGIQIGVSTLDAEYALWQEILSPFGVLIRKNAMEMARLYTLLFCFENSVRTLVKERLVEAFAAEWWDKGVPRSVKQYAEQRKQEAEKSAWLEGEKSDLLGFVNFGHLADIIVQNWDRFSDLIPTQHWLKQRMDELEQARNYVAHNRMLLPNEFGRMYMYIKDWNHVVGL